MAMSKVTIRSILRDNIGKAPNKLVNNLEFLMLNQRVKTLEWVLLQTGRWTDDSDVGLIAMSADPLDRAIADEIFNIHEQIEKTGIVV